MESGTCMLCCLKVVSGMGQLVLLSVVPLLVQKESFQGDFHYCGFYIPKPRFRINLGDPRVHSLLFAACV